jgi:hypothetical protein
VAPLGGDGHAAQGAALGRPGGCVRGAERHRHADPDHRSNRLRDVAVALGELRVRILEAILVRDMSFSRAGPAVAAVPQDGTGMGGRGSWRWPRRQSRAASDLLRNAHPKETVYLPVRPGRCRVLRPGVTTRLPAAILHTPAARTLLTRQLITVVDGRLGR